MKAVVLELRDASAAVLDKEGIVSIVPDRDYRVGQVVEFKEGELAFRERKRNRTSFFRTMSTKAAAAAAALVIAAGGAGTYTAVAMPASTVTVECEPSIQYQLNALGRVLSVDALNEEAQGLKEDLGSRVKGKKLNDAVQITLSVFEEKGYIGEEEENPLVFTAEGSWLVNKEKLENTMLSSADQWNQEHDTVVSVEMVEVTQELSQEARNQNTTPGQVVLGQRREEFSSGQEAYESQESSSMQDGQAPSQDQTSGQPQEPAAGDIPQNDLGNRFDAGFSSGESSPQGDASLEQPSQQGEQSQGNTSQQGKPQGEEQAAPSGEKPGESAQGSGEGPGGHLLFQGSSSENQNPAQNQTQPSAQTEGNGTWQNENGPGQGGSAPAQNNPGQGESAPASSTPGQGSSGQEGAESGGSGPDGTHQQSDAAVQSQDGGSEPEMVVIGGEDSQGQSGPGGEFSGNVPSQEGNPAGEQNPGSSDGSQMGQPSDAQDAQSGQPNVQDSQSPQGEGGAGGFEGTMGQGQMGEMVQSTEENLAQESSQSQMGQEAFQGNGENSGPAPGEANQGQGQGSNGAFGTDSSFQGGGMEAGGAAGSDAFGGSTQAGGAGGFGGPGGAQGGPGGF